MHKTAASHWRLSLALDLAPWLISSGLFLWLYIGRFDAPASAAWPHLKIVSSLWLALACLKLLLWQCFPRSRPARAVVSIVITTALGLLLGYYLVAYVGLASWGRIITWPLISAYLSQADDVLGSLGYSLHIPLMTVTLLFCLLLFCTYRWMLGEAWIARIIHSGKVRVAAPLTLLAVALLGFEILMIPPVNAQEPLSLSFFSGAGNAMQSHSRAGPRIDAEEAAARNSYHSVPLDNPPNVILIVGDALRADHLHAYGYSRASTPKLDALLSRESNARVERVRTVCAESTCGLLALASSRYVHELPARPITLQEVLRRHGYSVRMILGGDHTNFYGLRDAYGEVDEYFDGHMQSNYYMNDDRLVLDQVGRLPAHTRGKAAMLQFHLMSSHGLGKRLPESNLYRPFRNYYGRFLDTARVTPELREEVVNYYDNGITQFDDILGELLQQLAEKGYLQNALVIVTGDHGEMLGEHGMLAHAQGTYEEVLSVPLLFIRYGAVLNDIPARSIASQIDIAPTILTEFSIPLPSSWRGIPLQSSRSHRIVHFQQGSLTGIYDIRANGRTWKYWRDWESGHEYVFDLVKDPQEADNLVRTISDQQLATWRKEIIRAAAAAGINGPDG
jgi:glucan phosphoethanolaminetransferase (alkaline phosphatase superfamily)